MVGGSRSTRREPTHTRGEHTNSTQKGPRWGSNLEPSRCEAMVLTTTPPCSPHRACPYQFETTSLSNLYPFLKTKLLQLPQAGWILPVYRNLLIKPQILNQTEVWALIRSFQDIYMRPLKPPECYFSSMLRVLSISLSTLWKTEGFLK